jgi:hypothetical protein
MDEASGTSHVETARSCLDPPRMRLVPFLILVEKTDNMFFKGQVVEIIG